MYVLVRTLTSGQDVFLSGLHHFVPEGYAVSLFSVSYILVYMGLAISGRHCCVSVSRQTVQCNPLFSGVSASPEKWVSHWFPVGNGDAGEQIELFSAASSPCGHQKGI